MNSRIALLLGLTAAVCAACLDPIEAPPCAARSISAVSMEGDTVTTNTGLRFIEGTTGTGLAVDWCHNIAVHYDAFLTDGTKFDSTRADAAPLIFAPGLGVLIDGFEQGVIGVRAGGTRLLIIPPALAYGSQPRTDGAGNVIIPGNSTLIYDIEVIQVGR